MEKAYKFRIYPNIEQIEQIKKTFDGCRFVYNFFLNKRIEAYKTNGDSLNYNACSAMLTSLKNDSDRSWLKEPDSTALQSSVKDLDFAYQNFFRNVKKGDKPGFPKWKLRKTLHRSYKTKLVGKNIEVFESHIKLPKLGLVNAAVSKRIEGRIINATVSKASSGKYFVSVCCTDVDIPQYKSTGKQIGVDMGIKCLVTTSDGILHSKHDFIKRSEKKLANLQRQLSRKSKGSNNRNKARIKVARLQENIANQRSDSIHKLTTMLVKEYDVICVEDLAIKNMVKNRRLAKSIFDASWGELIRQLQYKCEWQHKLLVKVGRTFASSQNCNKCGYKNADVKNLKVRSWDCPCCGVLLDRDVNAAINILHEGLRLIA